MHNKLTFFVFIHRTGQQSASAAGPGIPIEQPTESTPQMSSFPTQRPMVASNENMSMATSSKPDYR